MSFDDYVHHMTQKYRLATAIAVLKAKPKNVSVEEYIAVLKNTINDANMDTDALDNSLGSDDFNFDDDDVMVNHNDLNHNVERESLNDSVTILKDINMDIESSDKVGHESDYFESVLNLLKEVDGNVGAALNTVVNDNMITQITFCESPQTQCKSSTSETVENLFDVEMQYVNFKNTQRGEPQDVMLGDNRSATVVNKTVNLSEKVNYDKADFDNYKINSATCSEQIKDVDNSVKMNTMQKIVAQTVLKNLSKEANENEHVDVNNKDKAANTFNSGNKTLKTASQNIMEDIFSEKDHVPKCDMVNKVYQNLAEGNQTTINDTQSTVLYSLHGYTQNFTHVSQSQYDDVQIPEKCIYGNRKNIEAQINSSETHFYNPDADNANIFDRHQIEDKTYGRSDTTHVPRIIDVDSSEIQYFIDKTGRTFRVLDGASKAPYSINTNKILNTNTNMHHQNNITSNKHNIAKQELVAAIDTYSQNNAITLDKTNETPKICESKDTTVKEKEHLEKTEEIDDIFDDDLTASQKEVISFKVIEELNKIKTFLNRKMDRRASTDSFSIESGYRSDSQSKNSFISGLQLTGNAINQSAHCLCTHLLQSPLVGSTYDITQEIASVLGRLIDNLHENEKYPSFLEDMLDSIDSMLKDIYEADNSIDAVILTKDESIQRLLLLNKSSHVIKYTIERITSILEKLHTLLTNEGTLYELINIDVAENACYIFHILEILIKRYRKTKLNDASSQNSTQNSQDSVGILKKSSITDIWRKKWNPEYKTVKNEGSIDKKCALTKCGEILNKVIVDCMEGYSLVSFAALQCFNLLQS